MIEFCYGRWVGFYDEVFVVEGFEDWFKYDFWG